MDEDIEFCRVCRGEATEDQPLFHPCKCSGSIRYVHQDCLIQWLNHSRKKHCELCKHQFTFTPVYRSDMPENLPYYLIAKGLFFQLISGLILFIRAHFVIIIWLVFLPNFISNLSRGSFLFVKNLFNYFILNRPEMKAFKPEDFIYEDSKNATKISDIDLVPSITYEFLFSSSDEKWSRHAKISAWLFSESIEGLLIISSIVISCLLVFLIREWVVQNNFDFNENLDEQNNAEPARALEPNQQDRGNDLQNANQGLDRMLEILANENRNPGRFGIQQVPELENNDRIIGQNNLPHPRLAEALNRNEALARHLEQNYQDAAMGLNAQNAQNGPTGTFSNENNNQLRAMNAQADPFLNNVHNENPFRRTTANSDSEHGSSPQSSSGVDSSLLSQNPYSSSHANNSSGFDQPNSSDHYAARHTDQKYNDKASSRASPAPSTSSSTHSYNLRSRKNHSNSEINERHNLDPFANNDENPFSSPHSDSSQKWDQSFTSARNTRRLSISHSMDKITSDAVGSAESSNTNKTPLKASQSPFASSPSHNYNLRSRKNLSSVGTSERPDTDPFVDTERQEASGNNDAEAANPFTVRHRMPNYRRYAEDQNEFPTAQPHVRRDHNRPQRVEAEPIALPPPPPPAPAPVPPVQPPQNDFEQDQGNDDANQRAREEMDGVLEALGIRGPLLPAVQNYVTVLLILSFAFVIFAIIPYILGFTGLLLEPLHLFSSFLESLQKLTNPIFDLIFDHVIPLLFKMASKIKDLIVDLIPSFITTEIYIPEFNLNWKLVKPANPGTVVMPEGTAEGVAASLANQQGLFHNYTQWFVSFYYFCINDTLLSRLTVIGLGYIVSVGALSLFLLLLPSENLQDLNLANLRRQLVLGGLMLRVTLFLVMEIILFPTFYGFVIDFLFLAAFKGATLASRYYFVVNNPITAVFIHWSLGTFFMFHFATFLKKCRGYFRPGVMWFVRDPADPNFHPFREILHRPILIQLKKIAYSCLLYLSIILIARMSVGPILGNPIAPVIPAESFEVKEFVKPYMWYLIFQLVPPNYFIANSPIWPYLVAKYQKWMKNVASCLRLSSFLFHNRVTEEEFTMKPKSLWAYLIPFPSQDSPYHEKQKDGGVLLVPTKDHIVVAPNRRVIIPLGNDLTPIDPTIQLPSYPTTVVYAPPNFYPRLFIYVFIMFFTGFTFLSSLYLFPTLMARNIIYPLVSSITKIAIPKHDGVDFMVGLMIIIAISYIIQFNKEEIQRNWRASRISQSNTIGSLFKLLKLNASIIYIGLVVNFLVPTLIGFAADPYIFFLFGKYDSTLRFTHDYLNKPILIVIFDRCLIGNILIRMLGDLASNIAPLYAPFTDFLSHFNNNEVYKKSFMDVTNSLVIPVVPKLLFAIILPLAAPLAVRKIMNPKISYDAQLAQIYTISAGVISLFIIEAYFSTHFNTWINQIRDDYYLMGQTLHNMEPNTTSPTTTGQQPVGGQTTGHAHAD